MRLGLGGRLFLSAARAFLAALIVFALCLAGTVHGTADANAAEPAVASAHLHDGAQEASHHSQAADEDGGSASSADEDADCSGADHCVGCAMHCSLMHVADGGVAALIPPPAAGFVILRDPLSEGLGNTPERPPAI